MQYSRLLVRFLLLVSVYQPQELSTLREVNLFEGVYQHFIHSE